ncbi:MAG: Gfo/Idh/MocA family oxidoreductase [Planctomycetes bacterium]|nr:Gfo/Idh/MocA family oxidoreductase [Planctomycetota bacterium]MCH9726733.1 Gfo/Idh/MocA family oxidoreductase [Planctomycetota bacterium]MCH9779641.1 Gfo/Idh/MocA family oxidoreductase [Planctomycetota bacterium]MCH9792191.1 Gfo/Idh/MocA family oxidoreductase [Planctomycetota bacterium]
MSDQSEDHFTQGDNPVSRRTFLREASTATAAGLAAAPAVWADGGNNIDILRVGLIGCGSRGSGAAVNAMQADPNTQLVAMADMFEDKLNSSAERIKKSIGKQYAVDQSHKFVGFDAFEKLLSTNVDVVLLATPPHFRPAHLKKAIEAGKHVFAEKPVAVDAPGVRSVLETCQLARQKRISIMSGLMLRYSRAMQETMSRIHEGQLGRIVTLQTNYNINGLWSHPRKPEWSEMEWQLRNWYYFTWLSGGQLVEQHVHGLDLMSWAMQNEYPIKCFGLGGRQSRTDPLYGHIFDHHAICYEYKGGQRAFAFCRQQDGTDINTSQFVFGEKGTANLNRNTLSGAKTWRYSRARGRDKNGVQDLPYVQEHAALFQSIRTDTPICNGEYAANSSLMAIMGRMASFTGKSITWEQARNSKEDLTPAEYTFGPLNVAPVALPGKTQFL